MDEARVYAPTGMLGSGFLELSMARAMEWEPHIIGCDAGSTDGGPDPLGRGKCMFPRAAVKHEFRLMLRAARSKRIPLFVGSAGSAGADANLAWAAEVLQEAARDEGLHFRLALIHAEQDKEYVKSKLRQGKVQPLKPAPHISEEVIDRASHIVGMMGPEPYTRAREAGADVVLAGRSSDTSIFAALPVAEGLPAATAWHAAKILECGAAAVAERRSPDGMVAWVRGDEFIVEPPNPDYWCTPQSVAAHTLYENADPVHLYEPSGMLDVTDAKYEAVSDRAVRVWGSQWVPSDRYTVKLEAAEMVGYQSVVLGSVRDPVMVRQIDDWLARMQEGLTRRIRDGFDGLELGRDFQFFVRVYGRDGTMGPLEPHRGPAHEVLLAMEVTAETQEMATAVADSVHHYALHFPVPEWHGLISGVAYPYSPAVLNRGAVHRFSLNHLLEPEDPYEMFPMEILEV